MEKVCFGVDIGGTGVKVGLFSEEGKLIDNWTFPTRKTEQGKDIVEDVGDFVNNKIEELKLSKDNVLGIGVGIPGPVTDDGEVLELANLGYGYFNIEKILGARTGLLIKAANDANVAALGEQWQGGGMGYSSMVLATLGTGVGGGIIINNKVVAGSKGAAGEIGHIHLNDEETATCGCGKCGCLEQYASATGIVRMANNLLKDTDEASALRDFPEISAKTVFDCAKKGDALALRVVDEACDYLGRAFGHVSQVVDPEAFVIGGGVSKAGDILTETIKKHYNKYVMKTLRNKEFKLATLGNDAGIYGSARMILSRK
ncbi:MAG TPA: ROK family glucokinase [Clostridiales bacterium]|nr:ROK family glucokinase [Clostridiales bacterium]